MNVREMTPAEIAKEIRRNLKRRSGKDWSVKCSRGTSWGWLHISAPPSRCTDCGTMKPEDGAELATLLGLEHPVYQSESVPASPDYWQEYIDRSAGKPPTVTGRQYWD